MGTLLHTLIIFIPAGISNMSPVIANRIPAYNRWNTPIDFGKSYHGVRIFGDHKTWRGIVAGTVCGTVAGLILTATALRNDHTITWLLFFLAMSFGALVGDAIKSLFKRRFGVKSGQSWFPFDQLDYIFGALLFTLPFGIVTPTFALSVIVFYFIFHLLFTYVGFRLGLKKDPL